LIIDHQPYGIKSIHKKIGNYDIIHMPCMVNQDANGLNQNPSSNKEDTVKARWHGDVDLEVVPRWHASTYYCTLLGCFGDVF
jgi:hypothetical protein